MPSPCRPGRLLLGLAAAGALIAPASAPAATIDAGSLDVTAGTTSGLQAYRDGHQLFFSTSYSGFSVRFADGPLAERTYGNNGWWGRTHSWTAVSESAVSRDGATQTVQSVYAARDGETDVARVQQTVRAEDDARTFRVTYRVENMTAQPLRYRALTGGELSMTGFGRALAGPPRFVGGESSHSGVRAGVEEVRASQLAGEQAPVAVAPWTVRRAADYSTVGSEITSAAGPPDAIVEPSGGKAVAVSWEDHLAAEDALAPGATARYEVVWRVADPPRLALTTNGSERYAGAQSVSTARLVDASGAAVANASVRWTVAGANATSEPGHATTDADGTARIAYTGSQTGSDTITVWADTDGDVTHDADEPRVQRTISWAPPPPAVSLIPWSSSPRAGETLSVDVGLYDDFGMRAGAGALLWSVAGANPRAEASARTNASGDVVLAYRGERAGQDIISVGHDRDSDGVLSADEPVGTRTITWRQAPPPPVTRQTLDAAGMNVIVSSIGGVQARSDDGGGDLFDGPETRFHLRVLDGPLAGRSFATNGWEGGNPEAFHGDPQPAATRDGDTTIQRSSWRVRVDDRDVLRVHQIARVDDGASSFRLTWRVENLTDTAMRLRVGHVGDMAVDGNSTGTPVVFDAPRRFVGISSSAGMAAGIEAVAESRLPEDATAVPVAPWSGHGLTDEWTLADRLRSTSGLGTVAPGTSADAAGVQWSDHEGEGQGLQPGAAGAARYELVWRLRRPLPLRLSPGVDVAETRHEHQVTATLLDGAEQPLNGSRLRWTITGAHPQSGTASTAGLGQTVIAWTGQRTGRDTLTVYADHDDDGVRDADEPQRTTTVDWRTETAVDPPVFAPLLAPDGTRVDVNLQSQGSGRFLEITPSQAAKFPRCANGSARVNLGLGVHVNAGAGAVVPGSMALLSVNASTGDLANPIASTAPTGAAVDGLFRFVLECLPEAALYLCYELEEIGLPVERFCVVLGGIGLWDPSGVVYDAAEHDALLAAGCTPAAARSASALEDARVVLHRRHDGEFRRVLSGDPFISPNVNPFATGADGRYGWNVAPGTYRVAVTRDGYVAATSRDAVVPPPDFELNVGLQPTEPAAAPSEADLAERAAACEASAAPVEPPLPDPPAGSLPDGERMPPAGAGAADPQASSPQTQSPSYATVSSYSSESLPTLTPGFHVPYHRWQLPVESLPRPAAPAAAKAPPAVKRAGAMTIDRRGRLRLKIACPRGAKRCAGRIEVTPTNSKRVLASKSYRVRAGRRATISVRIATRARAAVRRAKVQRVRVTGRQNGCVFQLGTARVSR